MKHGRGRPGRAAERIHTVDLRRVAYDPAAWQNFYVMTGGAAAALTGLLFVAMSLHSKAIVDNLFYRRRAIGALTLSTTQLFIAAAVLTPGQSVGAIGAEVEVAALLLFGAMVRQLFVRRPSGAAARSPLKEGATMLQVGVWNALFLGSGLTLMTRTGPGFYLLAVFMLEVFGWNMYVSWILIAEVSE